VSKPSDHAPREKFAEEAKALRMRLWDLERRIAANPVAITPRRRGQLGVARTELMRAQVIIAAAESYIMHEPEVGKPKGKRR
jgi:hypothetical protein